MPPRKDKFKAYKMRMSGKSYSEISRSLGVPKGTLSSWFSALDIPAEALEKIRKRTYEKSTKVLISRNKAQVQKAQTRAFTIRHSSSGDIGRISKRDLFVVGVALYWAEGHKRPITRNGQQKTYHPVSLTNSDPKLIALFVRFLRDVCKVSDEKIFIGLRVFEHQDHAYLLDFWQNVVKIPIGRFSKTIQSKSVSSGGVRPFNTLPYGVVQVRVGDTQLYHKIMGWIDGLGQ